MVSSHLSFFSPSSAIWKSDLACFIQFCQIAIGKGGIPQYWYTVIRSRGVNNDSLTRNTYYFQEAFSVMFKL